MRPAPTTFFIPISFAPVSHATGCGKIHKIDTGDDQDKGGNDGKQSDIYDPAAALHSVLILIIQITIGESAEEELRIPSFSALFHKDIMQEFPVEGVEIYVGPEQYKRMRIGVIPFLEPGTSFQREIEVEQQIGLFGSLGRVGLENATDLIVARKIILVEMDDLADKVMCGSE